MQAMQACKHDHPHVSVPVRCSPLRCKDCMSNTVLWHSWQAVWQAILACSACLHRCVQREQSTPLEKPPQCYR